MSKPNYELLFRGACQIGERTTEQAIHYAEMTRDLRRVSFLLHRSQELAIKELERGRPSKALEVLKTALEYTKRK